MLRFMFRNTRFMKDLNQVITGYILIILLMILTYLVAYGEMFGEYESYIIGALIMCLIIVGLQSVYEHYEFLEKVDEGEYDILKEMEE